MSENSTALIKRHVMTPERALSYGKLFAQSQFFKDATDAAKAAVKVLAGAELGLGPFASMAGFDIIEGKVEMTSNLQAALIKQSGKYDYILEKLDNNGCVLVFLELVGETWTRKGISSFTTEDRDLAKVHIGKDGKVKPNWNSWPRNMMFARALTNGAAWFCPDLVMTRLYAPGELGGPETEDLYTGDNVPVAEVVSEPERSEEVTAMRNFVLANYKLTEKQISVINEYYTSYAKTDEDCIVFYRAGVRNLGHDLDADIAASQQQMSLEMPPSTDGQPAEESIHESQSVNEEINVPTE